MEVLGSFKNLGSFFFCKDRGPQEEMKFRVVEEVQTLCASIMMFFFVSCVSVGGKKELFEGGVVPAMMSGAETLSFMNVERNKQDLSEMKR